MEISLALGGGGIKGIAHIGVLERLEKEGFKVAAIAGTSVGALVGAVYAAGYGPREMEGILESINQKRMYARLPTDGPSLLGYTGLAEALVEILGESTFSDLEIPFSCTAVDTRTAQEIYLNNGRVVDAVLASIAIPGVFPPRQIGEYNLVDGGVLDPVPVLLARCMAPRLPVVAVALNPPREEWHRIPQFNLIPNMPFPIPPPIMEGFARLRVGQAFQIFVHSIDITSRMLTELRLEVDKPEVIVRPDVHLYGLLDQVEPHSLIDAGDLATEAVLPELRRALSWPNTLWRRFRQPSHGRGRYSQPAPVTPCEDVSPAAEEAQDGQPNGVRGKANGNAQHTARQNNASKPLPGAPAGPKPAGDE